MRTLVLFALSFLACGNGFPPLGAPDGGDGGAVSCDPTKPFGAPVPLVMSDPGTYDFSPYLSDDELTMYFSGVRNDAGITNDFVTSRPTPTAAFGAVTLLSITLPSVNDGSPAITSDGLTLYFGSSRSGPSFDIYIATRATLQSAFVAPAPLDTINDPANDDVQPTPDADGALWFASSRLGNHEIYVAAHTSSGFGAPTQVTELSSNADETFPTLSADGLTIFFCTTRTGKRKIWTAHRDSKTVPFSAPVAVTELTTLAGEQLPRWLSRDGCRLYMTQTTTPSAYANFVAARGK